MANCSLLFRFLGTGSYNTKNPKSNFFWKYKHFNPRTSLIRLSFLEFRRYQNLDTFFCTLKSRFSEIPTISHYKAHISSLSIKILKKAFFFLLDSQFTKPSSRLLYFIFLKYYIRKVLLLLLKLGWINLLSDGVLVANFLDIYLNTFLAYNQRKWLKIISVWLV